MNLTLLPTLQLTEKQEQKLLVKWMKSYPSPLLWDATIHIPNEGKRHVITGSELKAMGMKKGVSDFFISLPSKGYHGLWIELKRKEGYKISPEQRAFIENRKRSGYAAYIAYGWEHAKDIIEDYLDESVPFSAA